MKQTITAIYENGVLRPLTPLELDEHAKVRISVEPVPSNVDAVETQRRRVEDVLIAAGLVRPRVAPDPPLRPLSEQERAELADRIGAPRQGTSAALAAGGATSYGKSS